ncbi:MAG: RNA methyltransferase [Bacteroidota bacterium]
MKESISSASNPKIRNLVRLREKAAERKAQGLIVIEGKKEIMLARQAGYELVTVFLCPEIAGSSDLPNQLPITRSIFEKIAYRENSDGLIALARAKHLTLDDLRLSAVPLIIVLEAVEKPGNLGAILRTADAAHADAVIVCDPATDIYNPNCIRSSVGCVFTVPTVTASTAEVLNWLKKKNIRPWAAALTATRYYTEVPLAEPSAIVMGTEATGLSEKWLSAAEQIKIPMLGKIDSLNVSTSCAIIVFEAVRQRKGI